MALTKVSYSMINGNVYSANDSGAVADGVADDTAVLQSYIDSLPPYAIFDGANKLYVVTALKLKSNLTIQNFRFKTKAGSLPSQFASPITIGAYGDTTTYSNIVISNVHVDGQRELNNTGAVGFDEDGGKHGFRLIGNINNVLIENCSASFCGSYGIFLYGFGTCRVGPNTDNPLLYNITIVNTLSQFNKAHGMAVDSTRFLTIDNCRFIYNGLAYGTDPGGFGLGVYYGNGIDFEGYGLGSWVGDVKISDTDLRYNGAKSLIFQDVVSQLEPEFDIRTNFDITNCNLDAGSQTPRSDPNCALQFTSPFPNWNLGDLYRNVTINGGTIEGEILLATTTNVAIDTLLSTGTSRLGEIVWGGNIRAITTDPSKVFTTFQALVIYNPKPLLDLSSVGGLLVGGFNLNAVRIQLCYTSAIAFAAGEEKTVSATYATAFPSRTVMAVPFVAAVTLSSDMTPPRSPSGSTTAASCTIKNGATAQDITVGFFVIGE